MKSITKTVEEWIQTQGYPLEFYVANSFRNAGFSIIQSLHVQDVDGNGSKPREIDVAATMQTPASPIPISISHVVECKYTKSKPWVVFTSQGNSMDPSVYVKQCIAASWGPKLLEIVAHDPDIKQLGIFSGVERSGFNVRQAHTNPGDLDMCYSSLQSVVTGAEGLSQYYTQLDTAQACAAVIFPVIVIDGSLFECYFSEFKNNLVIQEINYAQVHWRRAFMLRAITTVYVITKSYAEEFAKLVYKQSQSLSGKLVSAAAEHLSRRRTAM